jgi:hypothetical protein
VPAEVMAEFAEELTNRNVNNTITGTTENGIANKKWTKTV